MELETHKIEKKKGHIEIFRKKTNPNEIFSVIIRVIRILSFIIFILFGIISLYQKIEISMWTIFIAGIVLFLIWILIGEVKELIIWLKKNFKPIMKIENSKVIVIDDQGEYIEIEAQNIRAVEGKIYSEIKGKERPKRIYFCDIYLTLENGNHLFIDVINSSKLFDSLEHESIKELRLKSKRIGSIIAKELNVQFFIEKKMQ